MRTWHRTAENEDDWLQTNVVTTSHNIKDFLLLLSEWTNMTGANWATPSLKIINTLPTKMHSALMKYNSTFWSCGKKNNQGGNKKSTSGLLDSCLAKGQREGGRGGY